MRGLVFVLIVLLAVACNGGGGGLPTVTPAPQPSPAATPTAIATPEATATPTAAPEYPPKVTLTERGVYLIRPDGTDLRHLTPEEEGRYMFSWSPDGSRIAVVANRGDGGRVSVIDVDGGAELTVFDASGWGLERWIGLPLWSPDGRQLAVPAGPYEGPSPTLAGWHTYLVNPDGSGEPVDLFEGWPLGWSPDGTALAFVEYSEKGLTLKTFDLDTHTATVIERGLALHYVAWSPDSQRIAYSIQPRSSAPEEVVIIDRDGWNRRVIAERGSRPEWSPDGKYLAFADSTGCLAVAELASSADPVCLARGRVLRWSPEEDAVLVRHEASLRLVSLATHEAAEAIDLAPGVLITGRVSLSPDGQQLTFVGHEPGWSGYYPGDLFIANADGTGLEKLVEPSTGIPWGPEWSPDGRYIAFVDGRTGIS